MTHSVCVHPRWGKTLWLSGNGAQLGIALEFGLRIVFAACDGKTNLFYEQPEDGSDGYVTPQGWRLYGGHRLWPAPESATSDVPDNAPIVWQLTDDGVLLQQIPDAVSGLQKSMQLHFLQDGKILLEHQLLNCSEQNIACAAWGINSMAPLGTAVVDFSVGSNSILQPQRSVSLWQGTSLDDPRLSFRNGSVKASFLPIDDFCKIGLYSQGGRAVYENFGQRFTLTFAVPPMQQLPDGGCNFELFLCRHFMELETLGTLCQLKPGEAASHWEAWQFTDLSKHEEASDR